MKTFRQLIEKLLSAEEGGKKFGSKFAANRAKRLSAIEAARNDAMKKALQGPIEKRHEADSRWARTNNILNRADDTMPSSTRTEHSPSGSGTAAHNAEVSRQLSSGASMDYAMTSASKKAARILRNQQN